MSLLDNYLKRYYRTLEIEMTDVEEHAIYAIPHINGGSGINCAVVNRATVDRTKLALGYLHGRPIYKSDEPNQLVIDVNSNASSQAMLNSLRALNSKLENYGEVILKPYRLSPLPTCSQL